jgi:uncharacterized protein (DUF2461 family)
MSADRGSPNAMIVRVCMRICRRFRYSSDSVKFGSSAKLFHGGTVVVITESSDVQPAPSFAAGVEWHDIARLLRTYNPKISRRPQSILEQYPGHYEIRMSQQQITNLHVLKVAKVFRIY